MILNNNRPINEIFRPLRILPAETKYNDNEREMGKLYLDAFALCALQAYYD